jgi:hypothetical protein
MAAEKFQKSSSPIFTGGSLPLQPKMLRVDELKSEQGDPPQPLAFDTAKGMR